MGGWGGICVASHLVGAAHGRVVAARAARATTARAAAIDAELRALYRGAVLHASPIPVKAALNLLGHEVGGLRLPLVEATDDERRTVEIELERLGLL